MNSKWYKFLLVTVWLVVTRVIDVYATFKFTPDLTREANPLVSVLGLNNWTVLIIILSLLTLGVIFLYYIHIFKKDFKFPSEKGMGYLDFSGFLFFGKPEKWYAIFCKIPVGWKKNLQILGVMLPYGLAIAGLISTLMWYGIYLLPELYRPYHSVVLIWGIIGIGCFASWFIFAYSEYKNYLQKGEKSFLLTDD
jgi:hypothetical protein